MSQNDPTATCTVDDAAEELGVSSPVVRQLVRDGKLEILGSKNRRFVILRASLDLFRVRATVCHHHRQFLDCHKCAEERFG